MAQPIVIVDYDPEWPALYQREKARILDAIGDRTIAIEHIGSTAVPGLAAKPIIDILVAVPSMPDSLDCVAPIKRLGYEYFFYPEFPERCVFMDGSVGQAPHHLHMTVFESDFWVEKLLFRDMLRRHRDLAEEYARLKRRWAAQFGADREKYLAYTEAKSPFIESVLARAAADGSSASP